MRKIAHQWHQQCHIEMVSYPAVQQRSIIAHELNRLHIRILRALKGARRHRRRLSHRTLYRKLSHRRVVLYYTCLADERAHAHACSMHTYEYHR
uniref:Uncharacterized protein n=1 Tax=Trichogramma kaykai TaxID=54128 RepID=A0ABD2WGE0_9HYME